MNAPTRPVLRWHGGKWKLAPRIIGYFPPHKIYFEPFGGAGSVLLRKPPSLVEVFNDLDDRLVNFFRVLRSPADRARLIKGLRLTPFSEAEYLASLDGAPDDFVEDARRLAIRQAFAHGTDTARRVSGFRIEVFSDFKRGPREWRRYSRALIASANRLRDVCISKRDWRALLRRATDETLSYVDPPYLPATRRDGSRAYVHELTADDHVELLDFVKTVKGMVVLSGYAAPLYDDALTDWRRIEIETFADGARPRTEILWLNPACTRALDATKAQPSMFDGIDA